MLILAPSKSIAYVVISDVKYLTSDNYDTLVMFHNNDFFVSDVHSMLKRLNDCGSGYMKLRVP